MMDNHSVSRLPKGLIPIAAISVLVLVILFALGILGGDKKTEAGTTDVKGLALPSHAKTMKVTNQLEANLLSWQGTVRSRLAVKISSKLNARIIEIPVQLDDRELAAAYNAANASFHAAQAQAGLAKTEAARIIDLYNKQAVTKQNYDAVLAQAQSALALANQAAENARQSKVLQGENILYAPFDGVVAERLQEPGDMSLPNQPIITFLKPDDLRLEVAVSDRCSAQLKVGMSVKVKVEVIGQLLTGVVDEISPEIDAQTHSQQLKIRLPKVAGLQQGQFANLQLACQESQQALFIPKSAVLQYGQLQAVNIVDGQRLHVRHIRTGKEQGLLVQVLSGLHDGDIIMIESGLNP